MHMRFIAVLHTLYRRIHVFHFSRVLSAPVNYEEFHRHPMFDYDYMLGEEEPEADGPVYVRFEDEAVSEEQTDTDVKNLESRLKITLQEMKEQVLGMVSRHKEQWRKIFKTV